MRTPYARYIELATLLSLGRHFSLHFGIFGKQKQGKKSIYSLFEHHYVVDVDDDDKGGMVSGLRSKLCGSYLVLMPCNFSYNHGLVIVIGHLHVGRISNGIGMAGIILGRKVLVKHKRLVILQGTLAIVQGTVGGRNDNQEQIAGRIALAIGRLFIVGIHGGHGTAMGKQNVQVIRLDSVGDMV